MIDRGDASTYVDFWNILRCPECGAAFRRDGETLHCSRAHSFPIVSGAPFLMPADRPLPREDYVRWIADYHTIRFSDRQKAKNRLLLSEFLTFTQPAAPVLDIGCGKAEKAELFPRGGYVGIDPIDPREAGMVGELSIPFARAAGERLPFADGAFASVILWGVLDHVADPSRVFAEASRVLRPGGRICVLNQIASVGGGRWIHTLGWAWRKVVSGDIRGILAIARHTALSPRSIGFTRLQTLEELVDRLSPHADEVDTRLLDDGHVALIRGTI